MKKFFRRLLMIMIIILFFIAGFLPNFKENLIALIIAYLIIIIIFARICDTRIMDIIDLWKEDSISIIVLLAFLFLATLIDVHKYSLLGAVLLNRAGGYGPLDREFWSNTVFAFVRLTNVMDWATYIVERNIPPELYKQVKDVSDIVREEYNDLEKLKSILDLIKALSR